MKTKGRFNIRKLAKLFYQYHFFDDELCVLDETAYEVLLSVYASLDCDAKNNLILYYDVEKSSDEYKSRKACQR